MLQIPTQEWWETDSYTDATPLSEHLVPYYGPKDVALVRAYEGGQTQKGWGLHRRRDESDPADSGDEKVPEFMPRYQQGEFLPRRALYAFEKGTSSFAIVMRSVRLVCIDIDGKNGGIEHASELGALPLTLAETSKSGTGYHLFYWTDETWDDDEGFGAFPDLIGVVTGVDIRGVGCVYHWPSQRWNNRPIAQLPPWLADRLLAKKQQRQQVLASISKIKSLDETETIIMQAELLDELAKPIPAGRRNNTLFAIGGQLKTAE